MIPEFPRFAKLTPDFMQEVNDLTSKFDPYSDFNFVSIFSWSFGDSAKVAMLNKNLVLSLPDYLSGKPVYSILGNTKIDESLQTLLSLFTELVFVPEFVIENIYNKRLFNVELDRDNFDYIYSIEEHASLAGKKFLPKRKKQNRFSNQFANRITIREVDLSHPTTKEQIKNVTQLWIESKNKVDSESAQEEEAISQLLKHSDLFNLIGIALDIDDRTIGFSLYEPLLEGYSISHFHKTDAKFPNSDVFLTSQAAKILLAKGYTHVNWEQDLGLDGLRASKLSYKPVGFLKKYRISKIS
jgi:uncharacterized protein